MTTAIVFQSQDHSRLERENRALRQQTQQLDKLRVENERLSQAHPPAATVLNQDQLRELMRLRGEVGVLREQLGKAKKTLETKVEIRREKGTEDPVEQQ